MELPELVLALYCSLAVFSFGEVNVLDQFTSSLKLPKLPWQYDHSTTVRNHHGDMRAACRVGLLGLVLKSKVPTKNFTCLLSLVTQALAMLACSSSKVVP